MDGTSKKSCFYNWMETRTFRAGCVDFTGILKDKIAAFVLFLMTMFDTKLVTLFKVDETLS